MGELFEHELQLRTSSPQRIVIDYSSPNIAKVGQNGSGELWLYVMRGYGSIRVGREKKNADH